MPISIHNEIEIAATAKDLYNYVTQPSRWHEWHPNSRSAKAANSYLATGDEFSERVEIQPLAPFFPAMKRSIAYTVTESVPFHTWQTEGQIKDGRIRIRYDFAEKGGVTFFSRSVVLDVTGMTRLLLPLLKSRMEKLSMIALTNLKEKMQENPDES
jgi:Sec-independent protein secretion pathway component TatC